MAINDKAPYLGDVTLTSDQSFAVVPLGQPIPNPIPPTLVNLIVRDVQRRSKRIQPILLDRGRR